MQFQTREELRPEQENNEARMSRGEEPVYTHVFRDRYGCACIYCEECLLGEEGRFINESQNEYLLRRSTLRQRPRELPAGRLFRPHDLFRIHDPDFYFRCAVDGGNTKFRNYLRVNNRTSLRQVPVFQGKEWEYRNFVGGVRPVE